MKKLCLINVVGLSPAHVGEGTPRLADLARRHALRPLTAITPALTCSSQATMLTGELPSRHGIVGNGWLYRDTRELRFWQQSNALLESVPLYRVAAERAARRGEQFRCAKFFWWFNEGAGVDFSATPKPHYGSDGSKHFDILTTPPGLRDELVDELGAFPFSSFWGPMAGLASSEWIAAAAASTLRRHTPELTLVYLPHLDYDLQRHGATGPHLAECLRDVDACVGQLMDAATDVGAECMVVSEYGLVDVKRPVYPNRALREAGLLSVRGGPFGEMLDIHGSQAFAACDHQVAHVYVDKSGRRDAVQRLLSDLEGVERVLTREQFSDAGIDHARAGEFFLIAARDAWFAYPYWLDAKAAPDFASSVDIHRKPGYDPCELFFRQGNPDARLRAAGRLLQKKLGFRYRMDVIELDASRVRGSHGRPAEPGDLDGAVYIGPSSRPEGESMPMAGVFDVALEALGLAEA